MMQWPLADDLFRIKTDLQLNRDQKAVDEAVELLLRIERFLLGYDQVAEESVYQEED